MTARDWVWLLATFLFTSGMLGIAWCWWRIRWDQRPRQFAAGLAAEHYSLDQLARTYVIDGKVVTFPQHVRIVRRPPYDWAREGD